MTEFVLTSEELKELELPEVTSVAPPSSASINAKPTFQPQQLILLFDPDQWEEFILEWAHQKKKEYTLVSRLGGANDYGIDVAAFRTAEGFQGSWDNYQCKHYADPLTPSDALPEIGKILWHSYNKKITVPDNYFFFAPKDCGAKLKKLLLDKPKLKQEVTSRWDKTIAPNITSKEAIPLSGSFEAYVTKFNFNIFQYKPSLDVIDEHRATPYHAARFGGGLCPRPASISPPIAPSSDENRYIEQLLEAYSDCGQEIKGVDELASHKEFQDHFNRSRQVFYEAESLVNFARDSVPKGTFEALQDEVFHGVKDTEEEDYETGYKRVKAVTKEASKLNYSANGLSGVVTVKDLRGICHQLANGDRLTWRK
ncbi:ABC-three component system protein [Leisingera caerulea]|uniref:ABC-three component system protein n=1 Tax=Leisingera caerulea TaxID=506591 RepID=UPI00047F4F8E|nr:ABC-three component system protein [Leisingera caerulea]